MIRETIGPVIGGIIAAVLGGVVGYFISDMRPRFQSTESASAIQRNESLDKLCAAVARIEGRLESIAVARVTPNDSRPDRHEEERPTRTSGNSTESAVAELRLQVEELGRISQQLRASFGLSPLDVLARDLGPKWDAIATFAAEFGVDAAVAMRHRQMTPADALARFGAPTNINSEHWTWRRLDADIAEGLRCMVIRFRDDGAADVEFLPR
jgi:predicted aconitase